MFSEKPGPHTDEQKLSDRRLTIEELAEKHREDIARIEQLKIGDDGLQRAQIILVLLGEQPAVDIFLYPENTSPEEVIPVLEQAGLYVRRQEDVNQRGWRATVLFISRTPKLADDLMLAHPSGQWRTEHEAYARLMGFPQTAIDAFLGRIPRLPEEERSATYTVDLIMNFIHSKDHWEEELEFLRKRTELIKQYAPNLYAEIMDYRNR